LTPLINAFFAPLQYLIPVKLLLGQLPRASLLARYGLPHYAPIAAAVRSGDVAALNESLDTHQEALIKAGTYLLLEKLKAGVYRTLFKRIHNIQKQREPTKAHQVPIALFQAALAWRGVTMDADECEARRDMRICGVVCAHACMHACACADAAALAALAGAVRAGQPDLPQVH
jgi:hypothetical protein